MGVVVDHMPIRLEPEQLTHGETMDSSRLILATTAWFAVEQSSLYRESSSRVPRVRVVLLNVRKVLRAKCTGERTNEITYLGSADNADLTPSTLMLMSILLLAEQINQAFEAMYGECRTARRSKV
jgi:hypothetical protein